MICGSCGTEIPENDRCAACGGPPLLEARYRLEDVVGQGGSGITYRATRLDDGATVCIKELAWRRMRSLDAEKLFRREAEVLRQLRHPGIPSYLDDFASGVGKNRAMYLVQDFVEGENLALEMEAHRYTEIEVFDLLEELLGILSYLHDLRPPVVHRDIKPSNLMRRSSDDRLMLVDFGSVKDLVRDPRAGATVAGTFGYMAPEQLMGQASPSSDVYGVGALAIRLLSRREPSEMLDPGGTLDWQPHVQATPCTLGLLEALLAREPARRPPNAGAALRGVRALLEALRSPRAAAAPTRSSTTGPTPAEDRPAWPPPALVEELAEREVEELMGSRRRQWPSVFGDPNCRRTPSGPILVWGLIAAAAILLVGLYYVLVATR